MNSTLLQLQQNIAASTLGLTAEQTQLRPTQRPGCWSIQQIVEHLLMTYAATETALQARLAKGNPTRAKPSAQQYVAQFAVTKLGYFPNGRPAPPEVTPPPSNPPVSGKALTTLAADHLARIDDLCNQAASAFGPGRCISHMALGPLSVLQWRRFHLIHGAHHVKQILAIRKAHNL